MKEGSMLEAAERALIAEGKELKFADLWGKVKADLEITPEEEEHRIGRFYTDLSMSGRFVVLGENVWDLRTRHTYDKVHIDVNDVYSPSYGQTLAYIRVQPEGTQKARIIKTIDEKKVLWIIHDIFRTL